MFTRHAHQFVALCLSALVTASMLAGVDTLATPAAPNGVIADSPAGVYA
jgi:hypothetical protein